MGGPLAGFGIVCKVQEKHVHKEGTSMATTEPVNTANELGRKKTTRNRKSLWPGAPGTESQQKRDPVGV